MLLIVDNKSPWNGNRYYYFITYRLCILACAFESNSFHEVKQQFDRLSGELICSDYICCNRNLVYTKVGSKKKLASINVANLVLFNSES